MGILANIGGFVKEKAVFFGSWVSMWARVRQVVARLGNRWAGKTLCFQWFVSNEAKAPNEQVRRSGQRGRSEGKEKSISI